MSTLSATRITDLTGKTILRNAGGILQVSSNTIAFGTQTTSSSPVASGLITSMTPINSNSSFFVVLSHGRYGISAANTGINMNMYVSVNGGAYSATSGTTLVYANNSIIQGQWSYSNLYIPGTSVSTISFQPYYWTYNGGTATFNYYDVAGYAQPFLTIFEVTA